MLIGLPNQVRSTQCAPSKYSPLIPLLFPFFQDGSFTLTLFAPFSNIESLKTRSDAEAFFQEHFPTALEWVGKDLLIDDFMKNPRGKLVTINVSGHGR